MPTPEDIEQKDRFLLWLGSLSDVEIEELFEAYAAETQSLKRHAIETVAPPADDWPCHKLPRARWCDHAGPEGFVGHYCLPG
jgi:hypothetical protein